MEPNPKLLALLHEADKINEYCRLMKYQLHALDYHLRCLASCEPARDLLAAERAAGMDACKSGDNEHGRLAATAISAVIESLRPADDRGQEEEIEYGWTKSKFIASKAIKEYAAEFEKAADIESETPIATGTPFAFKPGGSSCQHLRTSLEHSASGNESTVTCDDCGVVLQGESEKRHKTVCCKCGGTGAEATWLCHSCEGSGKQPTAAGGSAEQAYVWECGCQADRLPLPNSQDNPCPLHGTVLIRQPVAAKPAFVPKFKCQKCGGSEAWILENVSDPRLPATIWCKTPGCNRSPKPHECGLAQPPEQPASPAAKGDAESSWRHVANEWADVATNGLQWLKNLRDGFSVNEIDEIIGKYQKEIDSVRELSGPSAERDAAVERLISALSEIATHGDDDHPCEHGTINGCRSHINDSARAALAAVKATGKEAS